MSEIPAEWLEKNAQATREGASRLQSIKEANERTFLYRAWQSGNVSRLQGKPQCTNCWSYISDKQMECFNSAQRVLMIHFECEHCKTVFAYRPSEKRRGIW